MKWKLTIIFLCLLLVLTLVYAGGGDYLDYVTVGLGNTLWCQLTGCTMEGDINMDNYSIINANWVNATYTSTIINYTQLSDEHWVNESGDDVEWLNVNGNLTVANQFAHLGDSDTYIDFNNDYIKVYSGGLFFLGLYESINDYLYLGHDDDIQVRLGKDTVWINESNNQVDFSGCIELDDKVICSWDSINASISDINITEGTGEHWVNESGDTMSGNLDMGGNDIINANLNHSLQDAYDDQSSPLLEPHISASNSLWYTFPTDANGFIIDLVDTATYTDFLIRYGGAFGDDYDGFSVVNKICVPADLPDCVDSHVLLVRSAKWLPYADNTYDLGGTDYGGNTYRWRDLYLAGTIKGTGSGESLFMNASSGDARFGFENFNVTNNGSVVTSKNVTSPKYCFPDGNCINQTNYQSKLENSSNITCVGNQCYYNGSTGETDTTVNNTGYVNIETVNTSTTCINNFCISDWSEVNISGNGGAYARSATLVVCANNSNDLTNCDYFCNGTQDQVCVNNAIDALPATGGTVLLMDGTYNIDASITMDSENSTLRGQGKSTRIFTTSNIIAVYVKTDIDNVLVSDLSVESSITDGYGIYLETSESTITNCWIRNFQYGVFTYGDYEIISNCHFEGSDYCLGVGGEYNTVTGSIFRDCTIRGVSVSGTRYTTISGCTFYSNARGIHLGDRNAVTGCTGYENDYFIYIDDDNNIVSDSFSYGGDYPVFVNSGHYNTISGISAQNPSNYFITLSASNHNTVVGNTGYDLLGNQGMYITGNHNTIDGNTLIKLDQEGILIWNGDHNLVSNNNIHDASEDADNTYSSIKLRGTATYNLITGNRLSADATNKHKYGIADHDSTPEFNKIFNNLITDAQTQPLNILGVNTTVIDSSNISENRIDFQGGYGDTGVTIYDDGDMSMDGNLALNNKTISGIYCINFSNGDTMCGNSSIDVSINGSKYLSISTDGIRMYDDNGSLLVIFNDEEKNFTARFEGSMMNNDNLNDSSRFVERNKNNGSFASAVLTVRNDIPYSASFGLTSSTFSYDKIGANTAGISLVAPGEMLFMNRYNYPFIWYINKENDSSVENLSEVMRIDEDGLNVSGNATFNYADFKTQAAKYHKNGFVDTLDTNWHNMTWNITIDTETTSGFTLVGTDTIQTNFNGIIEFDFCLHPKNNGAGGTEMGVLTRLIVDDVETRCSQGFDTQTRKTGYGSDLRVSGTVNVTEGSIIRLEYKVDNTDLDFEGNSGFDRPVAATIEFSKFSDLE